MDDSPRPDTPGDLEASMLNVIDEVDSCLERILVRRTSSTNTARNRNSGNMDSISPANETIAEQVRDGIQSDNSSDATIELDDDYAAGQPSTSGVVNGSPEDEVMSVEEVATQSVILPENVPLPRQLRSEDYAAGQPSTSGLTTGGPHEVVPVEELGTQSVILPELVPLPRQLRSEEIIDLSDSLTTYSPRAAARNPRGSAAADVIELSSDEEGPSTSRPTAAAQTLMHITYSTCTSHPSSQSTNIVIDVLPPTFSYGNARSTPTYNPGPIYTLDSPGNIRQASVRSRRNAQHPRISNPRTVGTPHVSESTNQPNVPQPSSANSDDPKMACPICYESLVQRRPLCTICGHIFCEPCLRTALKISKKCPICNRSITKPNQMHPIYLQLNQP